MRPKSHVLFVLALVAFLVVGAVPARADYVPGGFAAYTEDLEEEGYVNGRMDSDRLMRAHGCLLERDAAYMFSLMVEAAEKDGIHLQGGDCYRSYNRQDSAWKSRCPLTPIEVRIIDPESGEEGVGTRSVRVCSGPPTARAGHSNHGWGRAVDFTDRGRSLTCGNRDFLWLQANAHRFGWVHPPWAHCGMRTQEAWHWEYAGVVDANLVSDYAAAWIFDGVTMARMTAHLEEPVPLPPMAIEDSEFFDRWVEQQQVTILFPDL